MNHCPYCHSKLYDNDDYCLNCGRMLRKRKATSQFNHIESKTKQREYDQSKMTPKVKLSDFSRVEQYSSPKAADKLLTGWLKNHNYQSTRLTDKEMTELNTIAKDQNKIVIGVVIVVLFIFFIRMISQYI